MQPGFCARGGYILIKTPDGRHRAGRRIILVLCGALVIAVGILGLLTAPSRSPAVKAATGPFSYIPVQ